MIAVLCCTRFPNDLTNFISELKLRTLSYYWIRISESPYLTLVDHQTALIENLHSASRCINTDLKVINSDSFRYHKHGKCVATETQKASTDLGDGESTTTTKIIGRFERSTFELVNPFIYSVNTSCTAMHMDLWTSTQKVNNEVTWN